jgi:DNA-binding transcriptional LysR family regulator
MLRLALAGGGITFATEDTFRPFVEKGQLVSLLDDFCLISRVSISTFLIAAIWRPNSVPLSTMSGGGGSRNCNSGEQR